MRFKNREQAANLLAEKLLNYQGKNPLVLGIPRGALPMAEIIAVPTNPARAAATKQTRRLIQMRHAAARGQR